MFKLTNVSVNQENNVDVNPRELVEPPIFSQNRDTLAMSLRDIVKDQLEEEAGASESSKIFKVEKAAFKSDTTAV